MDDDFFPMIEVKCKKCGSSNCEILFTSGFEDACKCRDCGNTWVESFYIEPDKSEEDQE